MGESTRIPEASVVRLSCGCFARVDGAEPKLDELVHCNTHCNNRPDGLSYPSVIMVGGIPEDDQRNLQPWSEVSQRGLSNEGTETACQICWKRVGTNRQPIGIPFGDPSPLCSECEAQLKQEHASSRERHLGQ